MWASQAKTMANLSPPYSTLSVFWTSRRLPLPSCLASLYEQCPLLPSASSAAAADQGRFLKFLWLGPLHNLSYEASGPSGRKTAQF